MLASIASSSGVRTFAIFPQPIEEAKAYLETEKIHFGEVLHGNPSDLLATGTPTLVLLDKNGVVLDFWIGKLSPEKEKEVIERVLADVETAGK